MDDDGLLYFKCHHGSRECRGNIAQSCALHLLDKAAALHLINCLEMSMAPDLEIELVSYLS